MNEAWSERLGAAIGRGARRPEVAVILPDLRIGEYPTPQDAAWLADTHGITAVVSLQDDADLACKDLSLRSLENAYRAASIRFERVPMHDGDMDHVALRLDEALALVAWNASEGRSVYLHCNAGMNRAPTVAIAFLHVHRGFALEDAREHVKQRRACVPFWRMLCARYNR